MQLFVLTVLFICLFLLIYILFVLSFKIIIHAYNVETDIYLFISLKFLYFFYIENTFVYCRQAGRMKAYLLGREVNLFKMRKQRKKRKSKLLKIGVKNLRLKIFYGNKNAAVTALAVGILRSVLSAVSALKEGEIIFEVYPVFNEREFKLSLNGVAEFKSEF